MPTDALRTFLGVLEVLRPAFTRAGFALLLLLAEGWIRSPGRHAITECLLATGLAGERDPSALYRFFSRGTWDPDDVGRRVFEALLPWLPAHEPVALVVDDTLAHHKGPYVFGLGNHLDAVRSTRRTKVFCFGHVWVVLAVLVPVPFARRAFALPVLFRLYRNEAECARNGATYRKKTELGRELLEVMCTWMATLQPGREMTVALDNGYANRTVVRDLPAHLVVVGAMRPDAALTAAGCALSPAQLAADPSRPWKRVEAWLYGQCRTVEYKTLVACWSRVCRAVPLRIVVVRCTTGTLPLRVFFCTEAEASARAVLEHYAGTRWPIEVTFRELKQLLGLSHAGVRLEAAVRRLAPFVGLLYSLLVLWALRLGLTPASIVLPARTWYRHKTTVSFLDLLRSARKTLEDGNLRQLETERREQAKARGKRLPYAPPRPRKAA